MPYLYCSRCGYSLGSELSLEPNHCPQCLAGAGLVMPMTTIDERRDDEQGDPLQIVCWHSDSLLRVGLHGRLDRESRGRLERELRLAEQLSFDRLVIDLRGLDFIDRSGVAALVAASRRSAAAGREFTLRGGPAGVHRALQRWELAELLEASEHRLVS